MGEFLDQAARILATPMPRRRALRLLGSAIAAAIVGNAARASAQGTYYCGNGVANRISCPANTCCAKHGNKAACCQIGFCTCSNGTCAASSGSACPSGCKACTAATTGGSSKSGDGVSGPALAAIPAGAVVASAAIPATKVQTATCATDQFSCGTSGPICCPAGTCCASQGKKNACCSKGQCVCGNGTCATARADGSCPRGCSIC